MHSASEEKGRLSLQMAGSYPACPGSVEHPVRRCLHGLLNGPSTHVPLMRPQDSGEQSWLGQPSASAALRTLPTKKKREDALPSGVLLESAPVEDDRGPRLLHARG
mmetsp:Transcript_40885/g.95995  ORF Transcript_40885/g.95995 Transcript_40885/m.95995 type:complete len:106 (+) Transcript_40885:320-637(+)